MNKIFALLLSFILLTNIAMAQNTSSTSNVTRDPTKTLTNIWGDISDFLNKDLGSSINLPEGVIKVVKFIFKTKEEITLIKFIFLLIVLLGLTYLIYLSLKLLNIQALHGIFGGIASFTAAILFSFVGAIGLFVEKWFALFGAILSTFKFLSGGSTPLAVIIFVVIVVLIKKGLELLNKRFEIEKTDEAGRKVGLGLMRLKKEGEIVEKEYKK